MARMIPAVFPIEAPPGERAVFRALSEDSAASQWIVLHSLLIADHLRQVEGEADFVIIIPGHGVLVVAVKSHRSVDRRPDGSWRLGGDPPTSRGPFQQASEAMHSLRAYLHSRIDLRSIPIVSAVWFTAVRARTLLPSTPEWHDWQVLDSEDLRDAPTAVLRALDAGAKHLNEKIRHFSYGGVGPTPEAGAQVAALLRPRFELVTMAGDRRRARKDQLTTFVDEQFLALDAASENRSVLFGGPAGSGKTFLALESARRELATGGRGRLLCFNRLLGQRLSRDFADIPGISVGTFHQELLELAGLDRAPGDAGVGFWREELPERALCRLVDDDSLSLDFLVVDEVQDLAFEPYLDVLDLMVEGGLDRGRVLLFGDFERQAIFENQDGRGRLLERMPHSATYKLVYNCRNLPRIGYQVNLMGRLQPGYRQFRRLDDGADPVVRPYSSGQELSPLLVEAIRGLKDEGFALDEIVVLSPLRQHSTAATTDDPWLQQLLAPASGLSPTPGQVRYSTIQAFKGLDAPAVVLTDIDDADMPANLDSLLYIGLTRATDRLVLLAERSTLRRAVGGTNERP